MPSTDILRLTTRPRFQIGSVIVDPAVLLAPMEDVSNLPFRLITKRIAGPGLMFTEFVSAMAVHFNPKRTLRKMRIHPEERPLGIQIFGGDPATMSETAKVAEDLGADILDINMGCWVPKVCRTGAGAALLKNPETAETIVRSVVKAVSIPVTVKVRAGWDYSLFAAPELALRFQDAGAKMITLHARYAKQGFDGTADWGLIERVKKTVQIPVIGNGDIKAPNDARRMLAETGCDGVMVGRAAISNPWALRDIVRSVSGNSSLAPPDLKERVSTALEHLRLMIEFQTADESDNGNGIDAEVHAVRQLRGQVPMYIKGCSGAARLRDKLTQCSRYEEVEELLLAFESQTADLAIPSSV